MAGVEVTPLRDGAVLRLTFEGGKGNVLTGALMGELEEALRSREGDAGLKLVLLRGAGPHFSFGASVEEHRRAQAPEMLRVFRSLLARMVRVPALTMALVEGQCLGGAFELILACDLVFAARGAKLGCPEIKLGVFPPALATFGPLRMGVPLSTRLLMTGESLDAEAAHAAGIVARVTETSPEEAALAFFDEHLAPRSAHSLRVAIRAARAHAGVVDAAGGALDAAIARYLGEIVESHDGNEGILAFLERRPPAWENR